MATIPFDTANIIRCYTTEHMNELVAQEPALRLRINIQEQLIQKYIADDNKNDGEIVVVNQPKP